MLTCLGMENFKAWRCIEKMRLGRITGVFGANSSGKSSILQFLLMLKQTAAASDRSLVLNLGDSRALVNLGPFRELITDHAQGAKLGIHLDWTTPSSLVVKNPESADILFQSDQLAFGASVGTNGGDKLLVESMRYGLGNVGFSMRRKDNGEYLLEPENTSFKFLRKHGRRWPLPAPAKFYGFPDEVRAYHENAAFLSELELELEKLLGSVYYLGPLRVHPLREYTWAGGDPADMGPRGENAIPAILAARDRGERISRGRGIKQLSLEEYVAYWLKRLGLIHSFRVEEIKPGTNLYRVHVKHSSRSTEVLITDVGFGVSQILPVLVLCYYVPPGSTILLEQPEIHLHPSVQAELADVFIDAALNRRVQLVIESHSEHLLRRLQRRLAEEDGGLTEKDIALYFCSSTESGSAITELDLDMYGEIRNWPGAFFGDELADIAAQSKAAMKRRKSKPT
jgi:predicted ATPase